VRTGPANLNWLKRAPRFVYQLPSMHGKTVVITGANSGLGKATAIQLAKAGATVVMACRDRERSEAARTEIQAASKNPAVHLLMLDLASQASVRQFAREFESRYRRLDVLINNAGVVITKREMTPDKIVEMFAVNYLSPFLLTNLLLPRLVASAPSRVINVTSAMHLRAHLDFKDIQAKKHYKASRSYAEAKLAVVLFTYELARRLKLTGVTVNCVNPGPVATRLGSNDAGLYSAVLMAVTPFLPQPQEGAEGPVYLASAPELVQVTGKYFVGKKQEVSSHESYDELEARRLWEVSLQLTNPRQR
jgi:NAD(P)-dependent dehydrogenase (short-subunit alcohol dehydrogenase family)